MNDDLNDDKLYTLTEASKAIGQSERYFIGLRNKHPEYFKDVEVQKIGTAFVLKGSDLKIVLKKVKK